MSHQSSVLPEGIMGKELRNWYIIIAVSAITQEFLLSTANVTNFITTIIMIVLNKIYFGKRASLFIQ